MSQSIPSEAATDPFKQKDLQNSHDILTCSARTPTFAYAHLELVSDGSTTPTLDNLQVKAYCSAALKQFLGLTGAAMPLDVLKVQGSHCWVRVPQPDLGAFAGAITAWKGTSDNGVQYMLQIRQCGDWLGAMIGTDGQDQLWNP